MTDPRSVDLIVYPHWLVPVEPEGLVLEDHALVVDGGEIVELLPADFARQRYRARQTLERSGHALLPGLVNAHTHAAMSLLRGLADDRALMDWLTHHIWPAEAAHLSREFCRDGVLLACAELIRGGVTCFNDMYFFPETTAAVVREVGLRAAIGLIVLEFPTTYAQNADEYLHKGQALHDELRGEPRLRPAFAPHAPYTVGDAALSRLRVYASELAVPIHMHLHETAHEVEQAQAETGERPWARLRRLELLGPEFIAVHMTQLTEQEIVETAELGVNIVHCPESNMKLASGFCPAAKLLAAGANLAIGTDGAASNNDLDVLGETRSAALLAKAVAGDAAALPAARALTAATLGGARALGWNERIGSLRPGKAADFITVDLSAPETQPLYDVISQLVYACGRQQVRDVFVDGRPLLHERRLLSLDLDATLAAAQRWRARIAAAAG
ncbi:MAG: TRZ/ATZ family hydrolase [Gammaproteobacteria bacterium]|nr:TRZ/ATZ family hydrolase [Gammaproteobacteria bacterium]